jgi:uncharacterized cupredoxin-like copper-binding protein
MFNTIARPGLTAGAVLAAVLAGGGTAAQAQGKLLTPAKIESSWLKADSAKTTAEFTVIAGMNSANGNMNFNGAAAGGLVATVPLNWHVVLHFQNKDQVLPHSMEVIPETATMPEMPPPPAFPHAATGHLQQGMGPGAKEDVRFTADRAGSFYIFCAVPGHGAVGMWIRLDVSPVAKVPSLAAPAQGRR